MSDNEIKMLQLIRRNPGYIKSDLANQLQIPWSTAHSVITSLTNNEQLTSVDDPKFASTHYKAGIFVNHNYEYFVGVSVGSSQIKLVLMGFDFKLITMNSVLEKHLRFFDDFQRQMKEQGFKEKEKYQFCIDTPNDQKELSTILISVCKGVLLMKANGVPIATINFAFPGHIDFYNQTIISTSNLCGGCKDITNSTIARLITTALFDELIQNNIFIYIDHNVKSSTIAEKEYLFSKRAINEDLMVMYLGKGVGISMVINGVLYRNSDNSCGQLGAIRLGYDNDAVTLGEYIRKSVLSKAKDESAYAISEYLNLNADAKEELVDILSFVICNIISIFGIKNIVFSGKFDKLLSVIEFELFNKLDARGISGVKLLHSHYDEFSAAVGAAMGGYYNKYGIEYSWKI